MWTGILRIAGGVVALAILLLASLILTLRTKWAPGVRLLRRFGRDLFNRATLRTAGTHGDANHVIRHVGRRTGTTHRTPIQATATDDGWYVMLPYGTAPDWLKNVRAAGGATLEIDGTDHAATDPRLVHRADVAHLLSRGDLLSARVFGVDDYLLLRRVAVAERAA